MRRYLLVVALAALVLATAFAQGTPTPIPILNEHFNLDTLSCSPGNPCSTPGITGWLCGPQTYTQKMSTVQYPSAPPEGLYVSAIGNSVSTGSILQTVGATVQANTTYTLTLGVGARADYSFTGYFAALMAGNVTLASGNSATPVGGEFVNEVIVYNSGATPARLGLPLQILVKSIGTGEVNIVAVSLTATPE